MKKMERELAVLRQQVIDMGNLTEQMVLHAIDAITDFKHEEITERVMKEEERLPPS